MQLEILRSFSRIFEFDQKAQAMFENSGGVDTLDELINHQNEEISKEAKNLENLYFNDKGLTLSSPAVNSL